MASRLPLAILVGWFALLAAVAPAWGCAASALQGDCCPAGSSAPCPSGAVPVSDEAANACCAAAPAPAAAAPPAFARVDAAAPAHEGSPDPLTLVAVTAAEAQAALRRASRRFDLATAFAADSAPIFLRTGRLRL